MELLSTLGQKVRHRRKERGLTLKQLAEAAELSERFVGDLEGGRANISVVKLHQVALALGTSMVSLLDDESRGVISLLGLRGAGKSSVGRALASKLGVPFFELDRLVEQEAGIKLSEIFAMHGEDYFRKLELDALRSFLDTHPRAVLATGGGLVTSADGFSLLLERTRTVWLKATPEEHWTRVVGQGDLRPMQNRPQAMTELKRRLKEREPLYSRADSVVSTSGRSVSAVVDQLAREAA